MITLFAILDKGIEFHPETAEPETWAFTDWSAPGDNQVVAHLRDDLKFNDGEELTAQDVVTSVEFFQRFIPQPARQMPQFERVEATGRLEVTYTLDEADLSPAETFLDLPILASHIWQPLLDSDDTDDEENYRPTDHGGPVGTGPFELEAFDFEIEDKPYIQEFLLGARHSHPISRDVSFIDNGAPFMRRVRLRAYPDEVDLEEAVKNETIDFALGVGEGAITEFDSSANVHIGVGSGWNHISHNLRRVPLDDKLFRQALANVFDHRFIEETFTQGTMVAGDLAIPDSFSFYRPFEPDDPEVERFQRPVRNDGSLDVKAIRDFLRDGSGAHDYTFGTVKNELVTGDQEIRVNGELLTEAHTDNDGNDGQGPLEFSRNSDQAQARIAPAWERWVDDLQTVGIPIETKIEPFNEQVPEIFKDENFDCFEMGWVGVGPEVSHLNPLFHSDGVDGGSPDADVDGNSRFFNPMGYVGADSSIDAVESPLELDERLPHIEEAAMKIYEDQPSLIVSYSHSVEVLSDDWSGWLPGFNRRSGHFSLINIHPGNSRNKGR